MYDALFVGLTALFAATGVHRGVAVEDHALHLWWPTGGGGDGLSGRMVAVGQGEVRGARPSAECERGDLNPHGFYPTGS